MKKYGIALASATSAFLLMSGMALAQTQPTSTSTEPPAVTTSGAPSKTMAAPVPGQNSFTEKQAQERLAKFGYTNVSPLKLDSYHVWRGQAMKSGQEMSVAIDYQGNITAQPMK